MGIWSRFKRFKVHPPSHQKCSDVASSSRFTRHSPQRQFVRIPVLIFVLLTTPVPVQAGPASSTADNSPTIRLLIGQDLQRAVVYGTSMRVEKQNEKGWQSVIDRINILAFSPGPGGVRLDGSDVVAPVIRIKPGTGRLMYEDRPYRGHMTILNDSGGLKVVVHMPLEAYLSGTVNGEIDSSWPMDAVKAQVVAARSYALYRINISAPDYDLKTDVTDLVYAGAGSEDDRAIKAVDMTRGQALYNNGDLIQAFFHSTCGGRTTSALEAWGLAQPAQEGIYCGECEDAPYARWNLPLENWQIISAVKTLYPRLDHISSMGIHRRTTDGRVQTLFVETGEGRVLVDAGEFRKIVGYRRLPSTKFSLGMSGDRIILMGEGYGHGVGLCQWGARGSALKGMDYRKILSKYYPGTEIRRAY